MFRSLLPAFVLGVGGAVVLIGLGVWQVQRLETKQQVIARIDARIAADPVELPETPDPARDAYVAVTATGTIEAREIHVLTSRRLVGPGYRVIAPMKLGARTILIDRGFIAQKAKTIVRPEQFATVTGNLVWPDEVDGFTPRPDILNNIWFARDLPQMAAALGAEPVLLVVRKSSKPATSLSPWPLDTSSIANDHLQYAITWFSLAVVWLGMTGLWVWRIRRAAKPSA